MLTLSIRHQTLIFFLLAVLMIVTRSHHFAGSYSLADASWVIFFLAGVYLRSVWPFLGLIALGGWLDFAAINWGGVDNFCISPAYIFMLPAYFSLWFAGHWYTQRYQFSWRTLLPLSTSILIGLTLCELFSGGGFYFFSGRISDANLHAFGEQVIKYFPLYIETFLSYALIAVLIHTFFVLIHRHSSRTVHGE